MDSVGRDQEYKRTVGGAWPPIAERKSASSTAMFIAPSRGGSSKSLQGNVTAGARALIHNRLMRSVKGRPWEVATGSHVTWPW